MWVGAANRPNGYGRISLGGLKLLAHRLAWELAHGPIPAGLHVLHRCDNPRCVRHDHLYLGTNRDNHVDKARKGRANFKLTFEQVREIRRLYREGAYKQCELAARFGVAQSMISLVVNRRARKYVD